MPSIATTWDFLRSRFRLEEETEQQVAMTFVTQLQPGRNEAQLVQCFAEVQNGEEWLLVRADVCKLASLEPLTALTLGARLRVGAVVLVEERYEVRRAWPLRQLELEDLATALQYLALEASFVRSQAQPLPAQPPPTQHPTENEDNPAEAEAESAAMTPAPPSPLSAPGSQFAD